RGRARGRRPARTVRRSAETHPQGNTATRARVISSAAQRFMAGRMGAHPCEVAAYRLVGVHPGTVAAFIVAAAAAATPRADARPRTHHSGAGRLRILKNQTLD